MTRISPEVAWLVSFVLVEAAIIDGRTLKVPNWLTFHFAAAGLAYAYWTGGTHLLLWAFVGLVVGLASLMPLYAIGGMGAGDVKLMAGLGAWIGPWATLGAFVSSAIVGGMMGAAMIIHSGELVRHVAMMQFLGREIVALRDPSLLAARAAERKPTMTLLPYAIPIAVGTLTYFLWAGVYAR
jgi:prepilin peptidase CpaA